LTKSVASLRKNAFAGGNSGGLVPRGADDAGPWPISSILSADRVGLRSGDISGSAHVSAGRCSALAYIPRRVSTKPSLLVGCAMISDEDQRARLWLTGTPPAPARSQDVSGSWRLDDLDIGAHARPVKLEQTSRWLAEIVPCGSTEAHRLLSDSGAFGGSSCGCRKAGDRSHSLMCEAVSAWRARRIRRSRLMPGGGGAGCYLYKERA